MITIFGKVRTLVHLLNPANFLELEHNITHKKTVLEAESVAETAPLYYVYTVSFKDLDYGEYTYKALDSEGKVKEIGLLKLLRGPLDVVTPEETLNIVMYDGEGDE